MKISQACQERIQNKILIFGQLFRFLEVNQTEKFSAPLHPHYVCVCMCVTLISVYCNKPRHNSENFNKRSMAKITHLDIMSIYLQMIIMLNMSPPKSFFVKSISENQAILEMIQL